MTEMQVNIGDPWFHSETLMLLVGTSGCIYESGACAGTADVQCRLDDGQSKPRSLMNECSLHIDMEPGKVSVQVGRAHIATSPEDACLVWQALQIFSCGGSSSNAQSLASCCGLDTGCLHLAIDALTFDMCDAQDRRYILDVVGVTFALEGHNVVARAQSSVLRMCFDGQDQGALRLSDIAGWSAEGVNNHTQYGLELGVQVLDGDGSVALRCPALQVTLSQERALCRNAGLWYPIQFKLNVFPEDMHVDATEASLLSISSSAQYLTELVAKFSVEAFVLDTRPLGLCVDEDVVVDSHGKAEEMGLTPGSRLVAVRPAPPSGVSFSSHLETCALPVTILATRPARHYNADIAIGSFALRDSRLSTRRGVDIVTDSVELDFEPLSLKEQHGTGVELVQETALFYRRELERQWPALVAASSVAGNHVVSSALGAAVGGSLGLVAGPAGAAAGVVFGAAAAGGGLRSAMAEVGSRFSDALAR